MSKKPDPEMSPKQGMDAIFELVTGVTTAATTNDLKGVDDIIAQMRGVVTSTGVEIPGFGDTHAGLKSQTAKIQCHGENTDAAMWLGDLDRARMLNG